MTAKAIEETLDDLARKGFAEFVARPVVDPTEVVSWILEQHAETALRYGRLAIEAALRHKVNDLLKKHSEVDDSGEFEQLDLSKVYPDFPKRVPAKVSVQQPDGRSIFKRPDHMTRAEIRAYIDRQRRLMKGIGQVVGEMEEELVYMDAKGIAENSTVAEWDAAMAGTAASMIGKVRKKRA